MKYYTIENLEIIDAGAEGKAVGKIDGLTVFVPFAVPGDVVDVEIFKKKKNFAEGRLLAVKKSSPDRTEPVCEHFGLCGGCKWQILPLHGPSMTALSWTWTKIGASAPFFQNFFEDLKNVYLLWWK